MEACGRIKDVDISMPTETDGNTLNHCLIYLLIQSMFNKEHMHIHEADTLSSEPDCTSPVLLQSAQTQTSDRKPLAAL